MEITNRKRALRWIFCVLALLLAPAFAAGGPPAAFAEESTTSNGVLTYELDGGAVTITGCEKDAVDAEVAAAFTELTTTQAAITITRIGEDAFRECTRLTEIDIPAGVTEIGDFAFYGCAGLKKIRLPDGLTRIGDRAFSECSVLEEAKLPDSVTHIGMSAFYNCGGLAEIKLPADLTEIGDSAFLDCAGLTEIDIPAGVTSIGNRAFYGCTGLNEIALPNGLTEIGSTVFSGTGISEIEIPASVATMGFSGSFSGMSSLRRIVFAHGMEALPSNALKGISTAAEIHVPMSLVSNAVLSELSDSTDAILYGVKGTYIIKWAEDNGVKHVALDGEIRKFDSGHAWKYVPYQYIIETGTYENVALHFEVVGGRLPLGLSLLPDGQFHGAPLETGVFTFDVAVKYPVFDYLLDLQELRLTVEEAGDTALALTNDYPVVIFIGESQNPSGVGNYLVTGAAIAGGLTDRIFKIADRDGYNNFPHFVDFWLDGRPLDGVKIETIGQLPDPALDYFAEEGSTVVTVYAKTFQRLSDGEHTIAAEFALPNADENKPDVRYVAAQKFNLALTRPAGSADTGGGSQSEGATVPAPDANTDESGAAARDESAGTGDGNSGAASEASGGTGAITGLPRDENGVYYFELDGSNRPLEVHIDMLFDAFSELYFDGAPWARDADYEARAGSTVLRVSAEKLAGLALGMHDVEARFAEVRTIAFAFDLRGGAARRAAAVETKTAELVSGTDAPEAFDDATADAPKIAESREEGAATPESAARDGADIGAQPSAASAAVLPIVIACAAVLLLAGVFALRALRARRRAG